MEECGVPPVLHILVVGFHHQKGCTVEYAYPPFSPCGTPPSSLTSQLPSEWRHLPHLALPDGCHNYEEDSSFFVLPAQGDDDSTQAVFGVACCRQVDSKEVEASSEVTRSTIQKSVCILCKYPYYGSIEAKISLVTQAYFEARDFSKVSVLQDALTSMNSFLFLSKPPLSMLHVGLAQQTQVTKFGHRLLQIFKALLLQKKVLLCGVPTKEVCKAVLSILSLFPRSAEALVKPGQMKKDEFGFPLEVFVSPFNVQPYMCLQQMDYLAGEDSYILVGVANPLFQKQHSKFCDLYVNMEDGLIDFSDPKLGTTLYLTAADLRFCDYVSRSVLDVVAATTNLATSSWFGSNEWVKSQYRIYLLSLLATSLSSSRENLQEFGGDFVENWLKGPVYTSWKLSSKKYTGMAKVEPIHLCHGDLTFNDVKLRLSAQATEYGLSERSKERVGEVLRHTQGVVNSVGGAVSNVRGAVGGMWSAASSAVSSWWWSGEEDSVD